MSRSTPHGSRARHCIAALSATVAFAANGRDGVAHEQTAAPLRSIAQRFSAQAGASDEIPNFRRHVVPLLGRMGCNGRACHGSFQGQGGFRLSLFGYDFAADHEALCGGDEPRVNVDDADASLIVQKPTMRVDHEGGQRFELGGWEHRVLRRWIEAGAPSVSADTAEIVRLEVAPDEIVFNSVGAEVSLRVVAHWADGATEDVTNLCRFQTNDDSIAAIDADGRVVSVGPGDTHVVAFYDNGVQPVAAMLPVSERRGDRFPEVATPTRIDELAAQKWRTLGLVPSELCTDEEFLRRVSLDLTGTLPAPAEVEAFLADESTDKRERKIDELLDRPAYAAWWTTRLCDYTGNSPRTLNQTGLNANDSAREWYQWIEKRVRENLPYDELAAGLVLGVGRESGASYEEYCAEMSGYYHPDSAGSFADRATMPHFWSRRTLRQPEEKALAFAHTFLGVRIQCAQCHKHPFDQWTKQDFDEFKEFFARVSYGVAPSSRKTHAAMQEDLGLADKKNNELRKELPKILAKGAVVPWREVFIAPIKARPGVKGDADKSKRRRTGKMKIAAASAASGPEAPTNDLSGRDPNREKTKTPAKDQANKRPAAPTSRSARVLGGERVDLTAFDDPREALLDWMRNEPENYFARAFVNRVWSNYFGVGIVDPPDDLSLANPPSNAALLDYLTRSFVERDYDMRWLHREITRSRTYQLSWRPNQSNMHDRRNFSRFVPRRLPAEATYDALLLATAGEAEAERLRSNPAQRAIGPPDGSKERNRSRYALAVFGQPLRETNCDCERSSEPNLLQTIYLRNDGETLAMLERDSGWLRETVGRPGRPQEDKSDSASDGAAVDNGELVRRAYLRTLSREPTADESARALRHLDASPDRAAGMHDLLWALVNTKEFSLNR